MVREGLKAFDLDQTDLLIVENIGNLVCPAEFNIGENDKVMIISITEGDDKPEKYPLMFQVSSVLLLNKIDLLPHLEFDMQHFQDDALKVNSRLRIMGISGKTGDGLNHRFSWIGERAVGMGS